MALSRQALSGYDAALSKVEAAAAEYVRRRVEAYLESFPQASVADVREFAKEAVGQAVDAYGDAASAAAADLYDELAEAAGESLPAAAVDTSDVSGYIDRGVRYQAGKLVDGAPTAFAARVSDLARDQVARRANQTMIRNAGRDRIRYARVPTGPEPCTYCAMLASRGFVYRTASSAAAATGHFHHGCRCKVVPSTAGSVEGYDPDEWADRWHAMEEVDADPRLTAAQKLEAKGRIAESAPSTYRRISGPHNVVSDLSATNPARARYLEKVRDAVGRCDSAKRRYGTASPQYRDAYKAWESAYSEYRRYNENCQRCVVAYEMRRRGYDVVAKPRNIDGTDPVMSHWRELFNGAKWVEASGESDADALIGEMPVGSRGTVYIAWKKDKSGHRSAHVFNFERTSDGIFYRDAQTGKIDVRDYFSRKDPSISLQIARTDNLELNDEFADLVLKEAGDGA